MAKRGKNPPNFPLDWAELVPVKKAVVACYKKYYRAPEEGRDQATGSRDHWDKTQTHLREHLGVEVYNIKKSADKIAKWIKDPDLSVYDEKTAKQELMDQFPAIKAVRSLQRFTSVETRGCSSTFRDSCS